jgi:putative heme-binding domain-containing protein
MLRSCFCLVLMLSCSLSFGQNPSDTPAHKLFASNNLMAWCIVPFDAKKRNPQERAEMLAKLGFKKFAYDYRAEHIPTFEEEILQLKKQNVELSAWWFPGALNDEAKLILNLLKKNNLKTQLWVTGGGALTKTPEEQAARIRQEAARIRPIAEAAKEIGCSVGLYNHGGWFGEPENQIAVIEELKLQNVGMIYNLHHAHDQIDRLPELLPKMLPHLYAFNLNGMNRNGDKQGQKILQLGQGELDASLLKLIQNSGYTGPIGILGHTQDDAEQRLQDNLDGLHYLLAQLEGKANVAKPQPRTPVPQSTLKKATEVKPIENPLEYNQQVLTSLLRDAQQHGNVRQGLQVFRSAKYACLNCHKIGEQGGKIGPELTEVGKQLKPEAIAEALLWPKHTVKPEFVAWRIILDNGRSMQGYKRDIKPESFTLFDPTTQQSQVIETAMVEEEQAMGSLMPEGLAFAMTAPQRAHVLRFLLELGKSPSLVEEVAQWDKPAAFTYEKMPLEPEYHPQATEHVNRDRLYDFYRKEALFFRKQLQRPHLLPAFPGLDGGRQGHWGNQNDSTWKDARWNQVAIGTVLSGVFHGRQGLVPKGVCVQIGEKGEAATCFNPQNLAFTEVWQAPYLTFSDVRHGFMDGLKPAGKLLNYQPPQVKQAPFTYRGYYRYGQRVVFAYEQEGKEYLLSPWMTNGTFEKQLALAEEHSLKACKQGSPAQWPQEFPAKTTLGTNAPYAIDTIYTPEKTPWNTLFYFGDHDFLPNGTAVLCTMQGEVWLVKGLNDKLENVRWKRFATGLHQALGLVVVKNDIYVLGRDQITKLHDLNNDEEADFYECFSNAMETSAGGHDFTCGLVRDSAGNFYTSSGRQGLLKIDSQGKSVQVLATGFRNADGIGLTPQGTLTVPCSEGDWTPSSMICEVPATLANTSAPLHYGHRGPINKQPPQLPLLYLPRGLDNSSGGQATIPNDRWGPLQGNMVHFSFGQGTHGLLLRDTVAGQSQGALVPLPGEFRSGTHRGKFNSLDGQLYVSGMAGWGSYTTDDGCFQRVRYTGQPVQLPRAFHVHENGIALEFTQPVDANTLQNNANHFAQAWNYRYSSAYGSPEFSPSHAGVVGHDNWEIPAVHKLSSHKIFVELPDLQPVNQLHLLLQVDQGRPQELFMTVHKLDSPFTQIPNYIASEKVIAAHPQKIDLLLLEKMEPNPFRNKLENAISLDVQAGANLSFSPRELRVKAGSPVKLTFTNPDSVPHNWVLIKPNSLLRVGALTNQLVADPEAFLRHYVPKTEDVLYYTDIVSSQQKATIYFAAPQEKGRYPFLCTFPGHWMVMHGELVVE